jgi:DNA-directed RNA polymerase sigma subunit (sigma70/sigma32)
LLSEYSEQEPCRENQASESFPLLSEVQIEKAKNPDQLSSGKQQLSLGILSQNLGQDLSLLHDSFDISFLSTMACSKTRIFLAALVLSSGACLSCEAFSAGSLLKSRRPLKGAPRSSTACWYARNDSLGDGASTAGKGAKRSRGRPKATAKKSSTDIPTRSRRAVTQTAAAASASAAEPVVKPKNRKTRTRSPQPKSRSKSSDTIHIKTEILEHELLTKQEEQLLGLQVRRSLQVRETIAQWMEEQQDLKQQQQRRQAQSTHGTDLYSEEDAQDDVWNNMAIYGSSSNRAMERYFLEQEEVEELYYQDGSIFREENENSYGMAEYSPVQMEPKTWVDAVFLNDYQDDTFSLTDGDVQAILNLPGGRQQLRSILLEGALARDRLMRCNIRLVASIAQRWAKPKAKDAREQSYSTESWSRPSLDEAIHEGVLGLAEAAERFDPDRGLRFTTYATFWVTNFVRKCFQQESTKGMRLPAGYHEIKRKYITTVRKYLDLKGEVPSMDVLANEIGVSTQRLVKALTLTQPILSLDSALSGGGQGVASAGKAGGMGYEDGDFSLGSYLAWYVR